MLFGPYSPPSPSAAPFSHVIFLCQLLQMYTSRFTSELQLQIFNSLINTSSWIAAEGVDFIDGDNTAFQTGWKTAEIDVSAYRGQIITLCFVIYDVGDEIFDSACLIDNVVLK